ncbi:hypothetical protein CEXT_801951 [Caerostris extrusa]|uniref:Uncharacterized protein n=1 Tax=Caerostris extrusa TaxID=172846 RepID=A0AAV4R1G3_CAEEX|nr:hypothetical protein CEXT_801951 [Caerostris extrusa]
MSYSSPRGLSWYSSGWQYSPTPVNDESSARRCCVGPMFTTLPGGLFPSIVPLAVLSRTRKRRILCSLKYFLYACKNGRPNLS